MRLAKWACTLGVLGIATASCTAASEVRQVYMALDTNGDRPRDTFFTDTVSISCDIDWVGRSKDTTIDAYFVQTYEEDPAQPGSGIIVAFPGALAAAGEIAGTEGIAKVSFTWTAQSANGGGKAPFPVGKYECRVSVNGDPAGIAPFDIKYPLDGCPADTAAVDGAACAGWVKAGATCQSAADFSKQCICGGLAWSCP